MEDDGTIWRLLAASLVFLGGTEVAAWHVTGHVYCAGNGLPLEGVIVAEEFARGLVDVPFLGPVLADDLRRALGREPSPTAGLSRSAEQKASSDG